MSALSGSFAGRTRLQATIAASDSPNHELNLLEVAGSQKSADAEWNGSKITYWGVADLAAGTGPQRGYFVNEHQSGDRDWGTFEGKITTAGGQVTLGGTWRFTGGNGRLTGISGDGSYKGRMVSAAEIVMEWEGQYQLAATKAHA